MNKTLTVLVCIMVAGVVVGASLPIFDSLTASSESVHNDGAGWVRFALDRNAGTEYTVTISEDENGVYVTNGSDVQTYDDSSTADFETILYADSNLSVWWDSAACHVMGVKDGVPQYYEGTDAVTIVRDADGVTVTPGSNEPLQFDVPTWAYIPVSTGNYGFFAYDEERGVQNYPSDMPLAVVGGGFAGVYAYNNIFRYNGLGLGMDTIYDDDGLFYGASWSKTAAADESLSIDPLDPAVIDLTPIDIDLDPLNPEPDVSIMAVPTPTYTDGDWGYDLITVGSDTKACIVSYSGTGGNIVVPATVGGYDVYRVGKTPWNQTNSGNNVINNTSISSGSTLTISEGIKELGCGAFNGANKLTSVSLPNSLEYIGGYVFYSCTGLTSVEIPGSVKSLGYNAASFGPFYGCTGLTSLTLNYGIEQIWSAFRGCTGLTHVTIPDSVTLIAGAFYGCSNLQEIIIPDSVTTMSQSAFAYISGAKYIKFSSNCNTILNGIFSRCTGLQGDLIIPSNITSIGQTSAIDGGAFERAGYGINSSSPGIGTLFIGNNVEQIGYQVFKESKFTKVVMCSDAVPYDNNTFQNCSKTEEFLDLSSTVDYSVDRHGLPDSVVVSDSIGDCFGYVSVVDVSGSGGGATETLISMLPLIMVLGLVLVAVGMFIWNRM